MELKPGDVVTLKSGGHLLTVAEVHEDTVACLWMGLEGELFRETLPLAVLELADADEAEDEEEEEDDEEEEDTDEEEDEEEDEKDKPRKKRA
ncbi:MAG: DUF2158 domain-containing protein [Bradyrhizobium sp.]